ncbi:LysE family translocator [Legionella sainthelensi]|uniref:LysE family translocator n=1 Tax=Legionella sainthelensi TaxID=28087 RepID=UPI000F716DEE|nr:LysE family translocator [Legionella sainthelensi]VEH32883.1 LysE type translocator [Legionella sainthelensi]
MTYFLMMAVLLNIMPGPAMFYVIHHSMQKNSRRTFLSLFGIECGTFVHTIAATLGLTVLLIKIPFFLIGAKYLCALFLIYLGASALKKQTLKPVNNFYLVSKDYFIFCKGVIINLLNPKVLLFLWQFCHNVSLLMHLMRNIKYFYSDLYFVCLALLFVD